ncbi:hypothetical protein [Marinovum sp.]|uniref:hypothetical protein n=1 Tax=Marinovum sp. TaxID=2024839 RepID=UPI002B2708AA|nr:hypothetical protein [Marinovum sp.]
MQTPDAQTAPIPAATPDQEAALAALNEAWAYFTPEPQPVSDAPDQAAPLAA